MSQLITAAQLKAIAGRGARADMVGAIVRGWPVAVAKAKLTTKNRAAHFLAQIMTETGGLQILEESGAYRAARILEIFGARHSAKIGPAEARSIAALPVAQRGPVLFNRVYGVGNPKKMREFGNTGPNDGWLYRGGGMMQATGKSNYAALEKKTGLPLVAHPELLHQPDSAFVAAYLEWIQDGRCNAAADRDQVVTVREIINGGHNGLKECREFLARAKQALADYSAPPALSFAPDADELAADAADPVADQVDQGVDQAGEVEGSGEDLQQAPPADPVANPDLFAVKRRLKAMNYNPGVLNDQWGGMTAGAIAGFINDRGGKIAPPASLEAFGKVYAELRLELTKAEDENPPFVRPVSEARAKADPGTVAAVAPEVVPAKRNFIKAAWASVAAFFSAIGTALSDKISQAWEFFTDHKDDLGDSSSWISTAWGYLQQVPVSVWILAGAAGLAWIAYDARQSVQKITASVQTGARQ